MEGGCSAPVGALAQIKGNNILLEAGVFEPDGSHKVVTTTTGALTQPERLGREAADKY
ncbi:MAG: hypothetical protein U5L96_13540 [Owenweeksia sp.]|nr:hypothetical protein [Owenweeksia sp.]